MSINVYFIAHVSPHKLQHKPAMYQVTRSFHTHKNLLQNIQVFPPLHVYTLTFTITAPLTAFNISSACASLGEELPTDA